MLGGIALNVTFDHFFGEDNEDSQKEKAKKDTKKSEDAEEEEATPLAIKLTVVMALTGRLKISPSLLLFFPRTFLTLLLFSKF